MARPVCRSSSQGWPPGAGGNGCADARPTVPRCAFAICRALRGWRLLAAVALSWPALGAFLRQATDTDVPWWDALPTAGSLAGQWLLGRKYVENWPVWVAVNAVSVGLFAWKGLWLTVVLYALFLLMALWGWRAWQQLARQHG